LASTEWKRRRHERKLKIKAAVRAYRDVHGDERAESLKAGARILRAQMAQAQVDKEFELRQRARDAELNPAPPHPAPHPPVIPAQLESSAEPLAPLEELDTDK
jgi:hypothetical protein